LVSICIETGITKRSLACFVPLTKYIGCWDSSLSSIALTSVTAVALDDASSGKILISLFPVDVLRDNLFPSTTSVSFVVAVAFSDWRDRPFGTFSMETDFTPDSEEEIFASMGFIPSTGQVVVSPEQVQPTGHCFVGQE